MFRRILSIAAMLLLGGGLIVADAAPAMAKEDAPATSEPAAKAQPATRRAQAKSKAKAKTSAKAGETRLPPFYRDVVTDDQRKDAASLYAKYNTKLAKLKAEIKSLVVERDRELENLLSKDQQEKLAQLKADAKSKRTKRTVK